MADVEKLKQFATKMEWEGGLYELVSWGKIDSGDEELNNLMQQLYNLKDEIEMYWEDLVEEHSLNEQEEEE